MKRVLMTMLLGLATVSLVTGCGEKEKEKPKDDIKVNTNEEVIKDQTLGVYEFKNTSLIYENGTSLLETTVTNNSATVVNPVEFKILVKDAEGNLMTTLTGFVGSAMQPNESRLISSYSGDDLSKAASIEYQIVQ